MTLFSRSPILFRRWHTKTSMTLLSVPCRSPHTAETHDVLQDVRERREDIEVLDTMDLAVQAALPGALDGARAAGLDLPGGGTSVQLWPHVHGTDAMYMVAVRRRA